MGQPQQHAPQQHAPQHPPQQHAPQQHPPQQHPPQQPQHQMGHPQQMAPQPPPMAPMPPQMAPQPPPMAPQAPQMGSGAYAPPPNYGQPMAPPPQAAPPMAPPMAGPGGMPTLSAYYAGQRMVVNKDRFIIGRGKQSSDLTIKDPNVSRQHAMVEFLNGQFYMVDMGSTNGVEYNGQRIARKAIAEGDLYRICDHEVRFSYR
jgi:hypothetical protein